MIFFNILISTIFTTFYFGCVLFFTSIVAFSWSMLSYVFTQKSFRVPIIVSNLLIIIPAHLIYGEIMSVDFGPMKVAPNTVKICFGFLMYLFIFLSLKINQKIEFYLNNIER